MNENANKFSKSVGQTMVNLAERWQDERQYEDIKEYQKVLQKSADTFGITLDGMTKRPFGCTFILDGNKYTLQAKLRATSASIVMSWIKA
jgi:hypothetical protein